MKITNPLYAFEDYLISRLGHYAAGFISELAGLFAGAAIGIGLLLLIF